MERKIKVEELKKYIKEHPEALQTDLAKHFKVNRQTIRSYIEKYKIDFKSKKGKKSKLDIIELKKYIKEHDITTIEEIAKHFDVSTSTVRKSMKENNLRINTKKHKKSILSAETLIQYIKKHPNVTQAEAAEDLGVSISTISANLKRYDIKWPDKRKNKGKNRTKQQKRGTTRRRNLINQEEFTSYIQEHSEHTIKDIATHFDTSTATVIFYMKKYNIQKKDMRRGRRDLIAEEEFKEYIQNNPDANKIEIGAHFGVGEYVVRSLIKQYGVKWKSRRGKRKSKEKINLTDKEIIENALKMLESIPDLTIDKLKQFLEQKNIHISEESILEYQKSKLQQLNHGTQNGEER